MKRLVLFFPILVLGALSALADDPKGAQLLMESHAAPKATEEKRPAVTPTTPKSEILGKPVVYGGYLTDVFRAEKKRPFFNLRTPIDPAKDSENLSTYPGTDKINGIVLFSIKF